MCLIRFGSGRRPPENLLFDSMGPLGHVKGRQPHDWTESHTVLGLG
jgi:hypothetical protein